MALKARWRGFDPNYPKKVEQAIINRMMRVGEQFISDCRNESTYKDQTGNLRSSIGYFILKGDKVIHANLNGKSTGIKAAVETLKEVINQLRGKKRDTIRMVGVAGMNYASLVEARGLNVITMQSMVAIESLDKQLKQLAKKTGREINTSSQGVSSLIDF
ncbi:MAG: hypothetical protein AB7U05_17220 [Mangrovibacterium sp.]